MIDDLVSPKDPSYDDVYIYRNKHNMIAIVGVRPNVILGRQYLFSPQTEPSVFMFWENMTYCSKKNPFAPAFKLRLKEIFATGTNRSSNFLSKQPAIGPLRR
jgi:hypothetical protein